MSFNYPLASCLFLLKSPHTSLCVKNDGGVGFGAPENKVFQKNQFLFDDSHPYPPPFYNHV